MDVEDKTLMAYLDGELSEAEMREVGEHLKSSPELVKKLEEMRAADHWLTESFEQADVTVRPDTMALTLQLAEKLGQSAPESSAKVISLADQKNARVRFSGQPFLQQAIAASFFLFLAFGAGFKFQESNQQQAVTQRDYHIAGLVAQGSPLYSTLEATPSLTTRHYGQGNELSAVPLTTFRATDGAFCREFITSSPKASSRGIACRGENAWIIKATVAVTAQASALSADFVPASQESNPIIDGMVMGMISGDMLGSEQEARLIGANWQSK